MSLPENAWLVDRSRIQSYHDCKRLRFLNFHWGGTGLERRALGLPLLNGQALHSGLAQTLMGVPIDVTIQQVRDEYLAVVAARGVHVEDPTAADFLMAEQLTLLEGLLRAWQRVRLPAILAEYDVVSIELEEPWPIADTSIVDMVRCDAILRRKSDGVLFILEFKSVSTPSDQWQQQWEHNSQMLANTRAIEVLRQEPVGGVLIEGIVKGRRAVDKGVMSPFHGQITQQSALCYGYKTTHKDNTISYDTVWSKQGRKFAVWEEMSISTWLADHYSDVDLENLFILVPPIRPMTRDLGRWERQTVAQEERVKTDVAIVTAMQAAQVPEEVIEVELDRRFPQNHNHCFKYFGHNCAFERLCFNEQVESDPIGSGIYMVRVPHHDTEITNAD